MEQIETAALAPVANDERIQSLDVVRGFALIGILLMNVEFFNRPLASLGSGMQRGLAGADYWTSFLIQYLVVGKFWTIFSLLFGMGFAVMLTRAERAGRSFVTPYLRRIAALAVFGALHHIFLFAGDILFSYAVAACALLIVLYGRAKWIALAIVLCIGAGFIPTMNWLFGVAGGLAFFGTAAWWLRGEQRMRRFGQPPVIAVVLIVAGVLAMLAGAGSWFFPEVPRQARFGLPLLGFSMMVLGLLTARYHADRPARPLRLGVGIYCFVFFMMAAGGAGAWLFPEPPATATTPQQVAEQKEEDAERAKSRKEREERIREETAVMEKGTYAEVVVLRAQHFVKRAPGEVGFAVILIGMFLTGVWFVRAGIMERAREHLPLFRKLAMIGIPVGIGMGLLGAAIAMHPVPGSRGADGWQLASGLQALGNLPASLGYASLVILMLHGAAPFNRVSVLAPFGRMALTNYLMQSLVASTFFFGYGFGQWGMARTDQMLFVAVLAVLQIALSHLWLAQFRYGPMEWLWRAVTYRTIPPMRIKARTDGAPTVTAA